MDTVKNCRSFDFGFDLKKRGLVKNIGFSFHDTPELLDEILTEHPNVDFVQLQINYIDWNNAGVQSRACYEVARKHNIPVIVMEPVKGGNLASVPAAAEALMKKVNPDMSVASWAIRFAASLDGIFMVLSGMNSMEQLTDNTSYMKDFKPFTEKESETIDKVRDIIEGVAVIGCTQCGYCVDGCPKKIAIPTYFSLYNDCMRSTSPNFSSQYSYYANITETRGKASACIKCRACEKVCPQKLEIVKHLGSVASQFEGEAFFPSTRKRGK